MVGEKSWRGGRHSDVTHQTRETVFLLSLSIGATEWLGRGVGEAGGIQM